VNANPGVVDFQWMLDNSTYTEKIISKGLTSSITLIASPEYFGKYKCFANNSIGMSAPCERVISGKVGFIIRIEELSPRLHHWAKTFRTSLLNSVKNLYLD
jgi:hypothetical protein